MWLDVSRYTDDSEALQQFIREKTGLFVMPGSEYLGNGNLFLRLNFCCFPSYHGFRKTGTGNQPVQ